MYVYGNQNTQAANDLLARNPFINNNNTQPVSNNNFVNQVNQARPQYDANGFRIDNPPAGGVVYHMPQNNAQNQYVNNQPAYNQPAVNNNTAYYEKRIVMQNGIDNFGNPIQYPVEMDVLVQPQPQMQNGLSNDVWANQNKVDMSRLTDPKLANDKYNTNPKIGTSVPGTPFINITNDPQYKPAMNPDQEMKRMRKFVNDTFYQQLDYDPQKGLLHVNKDRFRAIFNQELNIRPTENGKSINSSEILKYDGRSIQTTGDFSKLNYEYRSDFDVRTFEYMVNYCKHMPLYKYTSSLNIIYLDMCTGLGYTIRQGKEIGIVPDNVPEFIMDMRPGSPLFNLDQCITKEGKFIFSKQVDGIMDLCEKHWEIFGKKDPRNLATPKRIVTEEDSCFGKTMYFINNQPTNSVTNIVEPQLQQEPVKVDNRDKYDENGIYIPARKYNAPILKEISPEEERAMMEDDTSPEERIEFAERAQKTLTDMFGNVVSETSIEETIVKTYEKENPKPKEDFKFGFDLDNPPFKVTDVTPPFRIIEIEEVDCSGKDPFEDELEEKVYTPEELDAMDIAYIERNRIIKESKEKLKEIGSEMSELKTGKNKYDHHNVANGGSEILDMLGLYSPVNKCLYTMDTEYINEAGISEDERKGRRLSEMYRVNFVKRITNEETDKIEEDTESIRGARVLSSKEEDVFEYLKQEGVKQENIKLDNGKEEVKFDQTDMADYKTEVIDAEEILKTREDYENTDENILDLVEISTVNDNKSVSGYVLNKSIGKIKSDELEILTEIENYKTLLTTDTQKISDIANILKKYEHCDLSKQISKSILDIAVEYNSTVSDKSPIKNRDIHFICGVVEGMLKSDSELGKCARNINRTIKDYFNDLDIRVIQTLDNDDVVYELSYLYNTILLSDELSEDISKVRDSIYLVSHESHPTMYDAFNQAVVGTNDTNYGKIAYIDKYGYPKVVTILKYKLNTFAIITKSYTEKL